MRALQDRFVATLDDLDLPQRQLVRPVLAEIVRLEHQPARSPWWQGEDRRLGLAFALAVLAVSLTILAVAPTRQAVAGWLGIGSTKINVVPPTSSPVSDLRSPSAESLGDDVESPADPIPGLGAPDAVRDQPDRGRSYTWEAGQSLPALGDTDIGVVLSVRPGDGDLFSDVKSVGQDVDVEFVIVEVGDEATVLGLWIGGTHELIAGSSAPPVVAERVLLWVADAIEYRLETDLSLAEVLDLAASIQGGTDLLPPG